jgi:hypothetical protein
MSFCSKGTVYRLEGDVIRAVSIGCGRRDCETCWPKRVGHLRRRMEAGAPNRLITLTFAEGEYDTPEGALDSLLAAWHSLVKKQRTRHGRAACEYCLIVEKTKRGIPHLHILVSGAWIDQGDLSRHMKDWGCGRVVYINAVHSQKGAARYLTKYLTKGNDFIDGRRSIAFSALYEDPLARLERMADRCAHPWRWQPVPISELAADFKPSFYDVEWLGNDAFTARFKSPMKTAGPVHA